MQHGAKNAKSSANCMSRDQSGFGENE
jgi:hypothetical protein